jgi:hypothetical protein
VSFSFSEGSKKKDEKFSFPVIAVRDTFRQCFSFFFFFFAVSKANRDGFLSGK